MRIARHRRKKGNLPHLPNEIEKKGKNRDIELGQAEDSSLLLHEF